MLVNLLLSALVAVEDVMVRVETLHLEHQVSHFSWSHMVEDLHRVTDNLDLWAQAQKTEQELAQAEAAKVNGRTHGVLVVAEAEPLALDTMED
jgi:hypothetical protein